jgi:hypothetical protein
MNSNFKIIEADSLLEGEYDKPLYDKFVEAYGVNNLEVETPQGWIDIE